MGKKRRVYDNEDYQRLYNRIERIFDVEDINVDLIESYLQAGRIGKHKIKYGFSKSGKQRYAVSQGISLRGLYNLRKLSEKIAKSNEVWQEMKKAKDIKTLDELSEQLSDLLVHKDIIQYNIKLKKLDFIRSFEEKKKLFKEGGYEERRQARKLLARESPQALGGLISAEKRRGLKSFREFLNQYDW